MKFQLLRPLTYRQDAIRTDPSRTGSEYFWSDNVNVNEATPVTNVRVPLQIGVASAITNATYDASIFSYTSKSQEEADRDKWKDIARETRGMNSLLYFLTLIIPVYHVVARITTERKEGVSQLVDVMGGGAAARVYSHVLVFNALYLPTAIISGVCKCSLMLSIPYQQMSRIPNSYHNDQTQFTINSCSLE